MSDSNFENEIKIQQRIRIAFQEKGATSSVALDIAFHIMDQLPDVEDLPGIYSNTENLSNDEITGFVYKFLAHVPNHLNAAMKLSGIGKVENVFNVNISEDEDE